MVSWVHNIVFCPLRRWIPASACPPVWLSAVLPSNRPETWWTRHSATRYSKETCVLLSHLIWCYFKETMYRYCVVFLSIHPAGKAMWERLTAPEDGFSKLQRENLAIIESYGKALMEVVCRDACDGHEISRVRAKQRQKVYLLTLPFIYVVAFKKLY